jgi:hypothetical protein
MLYLNNLNLISEFIYCKISYYIINKRIIYFIIIIFKIFYFNKEYNIKFFLIKLNDIILLV